MSDFSVCIEKAKTLSKLEDYIQMAIDSQGPLKSVNVQVMQDLIEGEMVAVIILEAR